MKHLFKDRVNLLSLTRDQNDRHKEATESVAFSNVPTLRLVKTDYGGQGVSGDVLHLAKRVVVFVFDGAQALEKEWLIEHESEKFSIDRIEEARGIGNVSQKRAITTKAE